MACPGSDIMAGHPTSLVALANDCAPTTTDVNPQDVLHKMQLLLNIVECHGSQLHLEFGVSKCKLLITARPKKLKEVEKLLSTEPEILTFYGKQSPLFRTLIPTLGFLKPLSSNLRWWQTTGYRKERTCLICCNSQQRMPC